MEILGRRGTEGRRLWGQYGKLRTRELAALRGQEDFMMAHTHMGRGCYWGGTVWVRCCRIWGGEGTVRERTLVE